MSRKSNYAIKPCQGTPWQVLLHPMRIRTALPTVKRRQQTAGEKLHQAAGPLLQHRLTGLLLIKAPFCWLPGPLCHRNAAKSCQRFTFAAACDPPSSGCGWLRTYWTDWLVASVAMATEAEKAKAEQKMQTLQFQNGKLSAQLEVQRAQITDLEGRIEAQEAKQGAYADTLLTVNSLWTQLNADIQALTIRATQVRCRPCDPPGSSLPCSLHSAPHVGTDWMLRCSPPCSCLPCNRRAVLAVHPTDAMALSNCRVQATTRQTATRLPHSRTRWLRQTTRSLQTRTYAPCCTTMPRQQRCVR